MLPTLVLVQNFFIEVNEIVHVFLIFNSLNRSEEKRFPEGELGFVTDLGPSTFLEMSVFFETNTCGGCFHSVG